MRTSYPPVVNVLSIAAIVWVVVWMLRQMGVLA